MNESSTLTPEAARARIDQLRSDPQSSYNRGDEAGADEMHNLYRVVHAGTQGGTTGGTAAPAAQTVSPLEAIDARLAALRSMPGHSIRDEEAHVDEILRLTRERDALRAQRAGETPTTTEPEQITAPSLPPLPPQSGFEWDEAKLGELRGVAEREGVDTDLVSRGLTVFAGLVGQPVPTVEETARILRGRWGSEYEDRLDAASEAWESLPKAIQQNLTETRVRWHPDFCAFMADVGERMLDPLTEKGMERRLAPYRR